VVTRAAAVLFVFPLLVATGFGALLCLYLRLATCDESCDATGRWWHDGGAWQWNRFLLLAAAGVGAAVILVAAVSAARTRGATAALLVWTICAVSLASLLHTMGYRHQAAAGWYGIAIVTLLGVVAIALAKRPGPTRGPTFRGLSQGSGTNCPRNDRADAVSSR
jgi:hypothetical protein